MSHFIITNLDYVYVISVCEGSIDVIMQSFEGSLNSASMIFVVNFADIVVAW